jgi:phage terminase large subunit GpA-like protein
MTAGTENDFTSHRADVLRIDEYQDCNQNFLNIALNRLDGSPYQFIWRLSNTREPGSDDHRNNDWLYQQGDQAVWQVPCPRCSSYQTLDWWDHFIEEKKSKYGAIESIELRDKERADPGAKDPRPICKYCHTPMGRLVRPGVGHWHRKNPAVSAVHGSYRFSNLYNPTTFIRKLYDRYKGCVRNPYLYNRFLNDQLGLTNQNEGDGINAQMLAMTARGEASGVQAYRLQPFRSTI